MNWLNSLSNCVLKWLSVAGFRESNEELQAQMLNKGLEEGRSLLANPAHNNSLAAELEAMDENEVRMDQPFTYIYQNTFATRQENV